jgi:hypothetical protein
MCKIQLIIVVLELNEKKWKVMIFNSNNKEVSNSTKELYIKMIILKTMIFNDSIIIFI